MTANLPAYDTLLAYCRQYLPEERITRVRNLVWLMLSLLHSTDGHLSSLAEVIVLEATELSIEQRAPRAPGRWLKNSKIESASGMNHLCAARCGPMHLGSSMW